MLQNEKCRVELYVDKTYLFPNNYLDDKKDEERRKLHMGMRKEIEAGNIQVMTVGEKRINSATNAVKTTNAASSTTKREEIV